MKTAKTKFLMVALCSVFMLTACEEQKRENPLSSKNQLELLTFISQNKTQGIIKCSKYWADPENTLKIDFKACESVAANLANVMNTNKFSEHLIIPEDLDLPYIWQEYYRSISASTYDSKKAAEAFAPIKPFNKNYEAK